MAGSLVDAVTKDEVLQGVNDQANSTDKLLNHMYEETKVGDEGVNIEGELHVGKYDDGKESVFGEGDSHTNGMVILSTTDSIAFTDNTSKAIDLGDTYETFNGTTTAGSIDYIGSDLPLCGIKLTTAVVPTVGGGSVAREYWNGSAWTVFTAMATKSDPPYTQRADNIGTVAESEQIRFDNCDDQAQTNVNGVTKYWVRFRIVTDITAVGEVEQIKLHTNRLEINKDGFLENFGDSVYKKDLQINWFTTIQLTGFSPVNESIFFASGLGLSLTDNEFANAATDGRGGFVVLPEGIDTSRGVDFEFYWTPLNNAAGDVRFELLTYQTQVGDTLSSANTPTTTLFTETIAVNNDNVLYKTVQNVDVEMLVPGEILAFGIKRLGNDAADTYTASIAFVNIRGVASFWHQ